MSPEELAEARHYATCYQAGYVHDLMHNFLAHIDQQAARIAELDDAVSGPLENITKLLETVNADTIFAGVIQIWKTENQTLRSQISDLEKRNADLGAQVTALQEIAVEQKAAHIAFVGFHRNMNEDETKNKAQEEAHRLLSEEHPEAFR